MSKIIELNAHWCDACNKITKRLRSELLNADFHQKEFHSLQILINAHVSPGSGIRVDLIERKRR